MSKRNAAMDAARARVAAAEPGRNGVHIPARGLATTSLDTIDPEPLHWLVPDYLPLGKLVMFAGDGGHGKSTLTLHLTACLTTGTPCFGLTYDAPEPCEVLLVSCEDDYADTVVPRLLAAGCDLSMVRRVDGINTPDGKPAPFSFAHYQKLGEELSDRPRVRLVVIDPAGAYIGRAGVDDHKDSELRSLLDPMAEMAAKMRVTVVIVKHLNKGVNAKAVHKVSGSAGYVNACRAAFVIAPQPSDETRKLFIPLKLNITKKPTGLAFRMANVPPAEAKAILKRFPKIVGDDRTRLQSQLFQIHWDGDAGMDADTALGDIARTRPNETKDCADWLIEFLGDYAWPDEEVQEAAEDVGHGLGCLKRAKAMLREAKKLRSRPEGKGGAWWIWAGDGIRPVDRRLPYESKSGKSRQSGKSPRYREDEKDLAVFKPEIED